MYANLNPQLLIFRQLAPMRYFSAARRLSLERNSHFLSLRQTLDHSTGRTYPKQVLWLVIALLNDRALLPSCIPKFRPTSRTIVLDCSRTTTTSALRKDFSFVPYSNWCSTCVYGLYEWTSNDSPRIPRRATLCFTRILLFCYLCHRH